MSVETTRGYHSPTPSPCPATRPGEGAQTTALLERSPDGVPPPGLPGFELHESIGAGGMGVVYRATDLAFRREVAVKMLKESCPPGGRAVRQFVEEARITGQLQHPGIPAAYHVGELPDGRPFFAMKLIKGETLATLLKTTPDRGTLLAVFEGVCHATAYAHSHGVVHRDLKPGNVMVGAFGEVQVMDWGIAKVCGRPGREAGDPGGTRPATEIRSDREDSDDTQDGEFRGTPAFTSPEQAIGAVSEVDARSDVFGLGAVLCALLIGRPPYVGADPASTRVLAARAALGDAYRLLDGCGADPGLVALCKRCLSSDRGHRPADAGEVAAAVAALRAAADDRARAADQSRMAAEVRAAEQLDRRRAVQRAAAVVAAVLALGVAGTTAGLVRATAARAEADAERVRAEENFAVARGLSLSMSAQIHAVETGLAPSRQTEGDRRRTLDDAIGTFERFAAERPGDTRIRRDLAQLCHFQANVARLTNDFAAADSAYRTSARLWGDLIDRDPRDRQARDNLAHVLRDSAAVLTTAGRLREAAEVLGRAAALAESLRDSEPGAPAYWRTLGAVALERACTESRLGRSGDAAASANAAGELFARLRKIPPEHQHFADPLLAALAADALGAALRELGRTDEALAAHDAAVAHTAPLLGPGAGRDALHVYHQVRAGRARTAVGGASRRVDGGTGRRGETANDLDEAIRGWTELRREFPRSPLYREWLAVALYTRGCHNDKDDAAAGRDFHAAREVLEPLVGEFPAVPDYRAHLGRTCLGLARVEGDAPAATEWLRKAKVMYEWGGRHDPDNVLNQQWLTRDVHEAKEK